MRTGYFKNFENASKKVKVLHQIWSFKEQSSDKLFEIWEQNCEIVTKLFLHRISR